MRKICFPCLIFIIFVTCLLAFPTTQTQAESAKINAGFVNGIWYSDLPFFAGDTIRVYVAFQNQSGFDISGEVEFFDNNKSIGITKFSAIDGRLVESWVDFKVEKGTHQVSAKVFNVKKNVIGGTPESVDIDSTLIKSEEITVDVDTDGDNIGDQVDEDDDNNGVRDSDEKKSGKEIVDTVKNVVNLTAENIDDTAVNLNSRISITIEKLDKEIAEREKQKDEIKQMILEGTGTSTIEDVKTIEKEIAVKRVQVYLLRTINGVLKYKTLLYFVIAVLVYAIIRFVWRIFF